MTDLSHIGELPEVQEASAWIGAMRRKDDLSPREDITLDVADAALAAADREVGRLKCCGNCDEMKDPIVGEPAWCSLSATFESVEARDKCHFTPSRWTRGKA